jgi:hypothetical protein
MLSPMGPCDTRQTPYLTSFLSSEESPQQYILFFRKDGTLGLSEASDLLRMQASSAFKLTSNPCPRRSHLRPLKWASKPRLLRVSRSRSTNRSYNPTHSQLRHGVGDAWELQQISEAQDTAHPRGILCAAGTAGHRLAKAFAQLNSSGQAPRPSTSLATLG